MQSQSMKKKIFLSISVLVIIIQFVPRDLPESISNNPDDFISNNNVPEDIELILKTSCYDCHSNTVEYPLYSYLVPVSFLIKRDIELGRENLNFSNWESLSKRKKLKFINEINESIESDEMPFPAYLITHRDAVLSEGQKARLISWFEDEYSESLFN